tara:strand:+ start:2055 stop:2282 length:228 start_codon:yes stop_codon:yes gene_type:complete
VNAMLKWIIASSLTAICYGLSIVEIGLSLALLAGLSSFMIADYWQYRNDVKEELDRIRTTQLLQIYDGGNENETD